MPACVRVCACGECACECTIVQVRVCAYVYSHVHTGKLKYTPPQDATGSPYTNFTFYVDDQQNKPTSKSVPVLAQITVTPVNDAPVAQR